MPFVPMGEGRAKREARETQEFMEELVGRFATDLKGVLEQTNKCAITLTGARMMTVHTLQSI